MPKVSVIIPIYNVEQYLEECLDSVIDQTLKDIEIICINDGSTDSSLEIMNRYAVKDARIKIISKENSGYGHTMNVGLDAATGEYIGIVEPDDYIKLDMYEKLYDKAKEHDLDLIKADFYRFTTHGKNLNLRYNQLSKDESYYGKVLDPKENLDVFKFIMNTWSGIYKREFLNKYHIRHNETPGASFQDNGFFFQTFCRAERMYFMNKPFYMYRFDNPNSSVKSREKIYCATGEYRYIYKFLEENSELKERYIYMYSWRKQKSFFFTLGRIDKKYRKEYLKHFSDEFRISKSKGELDEKVFTASEWKDINAIIDSPAKYYKSHYGLIGLFTKVYKCLKECGLLYTLRMIKKKVFNR